MGVFQSATLRITLLLMPLFELRIVLPQLCGNWQAFHARRTRRYQGSLWTGLWDSACTGDRVNGRLGGAIDVLSSPFPLCDMNPFGGRACAASCRRAKEPPVHEDHSIHSKHQLATQLDSSNTMAEKSTTPSALFNNPAADIVLLSKDLVEFRVHSYVLKATRYVHRPSRKESLE